VKENRGEETMTKRRHVAGKMFRTRKEAVAYRRTILAVTFGGWVLAMVFAGMWVYERWIL